MKQQYKRWVIFLTVISFFIVFMVAPNGLFQNNSVFYPETSGSVQVFDNPDFNGYHDGWLITDWSSAGFYPTQAQTLTEDGYVSFRQTGYMLSFFAVGAYQGSGPTAFGWGERTLYVPINGSCRNIVRWKGMMNFENATLISCLGMGVDFWFDAVFPDGTNKPVEMYIFFYMAGAYQIPVGTYKTTIRQDYNYTSETMGLEWDYVYFHRSHLSLGVDSTESFELYDYVSQYKQINPEYRNANFVLTEVAPVMELFMASGEFTVDYCGLEISPK